MLGDNDRRSLGLWVLSSHILSGKCQWTTLLVMADRPKRTRMTCRKSVCRDVRSIAAHACVELVKAAEDTMLAMSGKA